MVNKIYVKIKNFIVENYKTLLLFLAVYVIFNFELPYIVYAPGGTINLNERIEIEDAYPVKGKVRMAYVTAIKGSVPFLLTSFILPDWDIVKKEDITMENENIDQMIKKDKLALESSIDNATIVAYNLANEQVDITKIHNNVVYITKEAETNLKLNDEIISVNGVEIKSLEEYKKIVESSNIGDVLNLKVLRNKKVIDANIKVYDTEYGYKTGISIITTFDYNTKKDIKVKKKSSESGPSGGAMLALEIFNLLTKKDITGGLNIVGTGTIDIDGKIGEIGGVKYKLMGAVKNKADIFICPKENYEEAKTIAKEKKYDIIIITDEKLEGIIKQLHKITKKEN